MPWNYDDYGAIGDFAVPGADDEPAVCDVCGKDVHTPAEMAECMDSALAPTTNERNT